MAYVTVEEISRILHRRLEVLTDPLQFGQSPNSLGGQQVDPELVQETIEEEEEYMNMVLGQVYELPFQNNHAILRKIAKNLVCGKILGVYFQTTFSPEQGGDQQFGATLLREAQNLLISLTAGHGVNISGVPQGSNVPGNMQQPILLPGEKLNTSRNQDTITREVTVTGRRNTKVDNIGIDWGIVGYDPNARPSFNNTSQRRARGSEHRYN